MPDSPSIPSPHPGILLVGHGTRSAIGQRQFLELAAEVGRQMALPLEPAFLELVEPSVELAVERLIGRGIETLVVAPLLLFAAGHAKADVPAAVSAALARHGAGGLPVRQTAHFGCHSLIVELACLRMKESQSGLQAEASDRTLLIMVGRGSHDPAATQEMHHLAGLVAAKAGLPHVQVAFMAMAGPSVEEVLGQAGQSQFSRLIVQPHLLFHGELVERLQRQVAAIAAKRPSQQWLTPRVLAANPSGTGVNKLLAAATADLIASKLGG